MKTFYAYNKITEIQNELYNQFNVFSKSHQTMGRLGSLPVALLDVTLDIAKPLLSIIEGVVLAVLNLVGAPFSKTYEFKDKNDNTLIYQCTYKDSLASIDFAIVSAAIVPAKLITAPLKIIFQTIAIAMDPVNVNPITFNVPAFKAPAETKEKKLGG